jgi:hypothetical protein
MQTWTKGSYKITLNPKVPQDPGDLGIRHGYTCGAFGVCRTGTGQWAAWSLSHTPSGLHIEDYYRLDTAKEVVSCLMRLEVDWNLVQSLKSVPQTVRDEYTSIIRR